MLNTKLFNFHDAILIFSIVIIWHILANPIYDAIDAKITKKS